MRKGDATRVRNLEEAGQQASLRGLATVSLNDVAEGIGISKSGVFKHFQSKEAMQLAVLEATIDRFRAVVWTPVLDLPPGRARLEAMFQRLLDWDEEECGHYGCLIQSATVEFEDQPGPIRDLLQAGHGELLQVLAGEFKAIGTPPLSDEAAAQAAFEFKCFSGGFSSTRRMIGAAEARRRATLAFNGLMARLLAQ